MINFSEHFEDNFSTTSLAYTTNTRRSKITNDLSQVSAYLKNAAIYLILSFIVLTRRMPVQRAALCIRNFPSQYRTHFRGLSCHNAGRFNATVLISMLSVGELALAANTSLLASIVRVQTIPSARERCTCSGVWRSVTNPS